MSYFLRSIKVLVLILAFFNQADATNIDESKTYDLLKELEFVACSENQSFEWYKNNWISLSKTSIDELKNYDCYVGSLTIKNNENQKNWVLQLGTDKLQEMQVAVFSGDTFLTFVNGRNIPSQDRALKHSINGDIPLYLEKGEEQEILFRFNFYEDIVETKNIGAKLLPADEYWNLVVNDHAYITFILGAYFILVFAALALFASTREMLYLYYALYIGIGAIFVSAFDGYFEEYILGQSAYAFKYFWILGCSAPTIYLLFMRSFLNLAYSNRIFDLIVRIVIVISVLALISAAIITVTAKHFDDASYVIHYMILGQMAFMLISQFVLMPQIFKDYRVRFFVIGSFFYLFTSFYYEFQGFGTSKGIATGALIEGLIFAAGMGYRMYKNSKNRRQILEEAVNKRTEELIEKNTVINREVEKNKALVQEIHHRVKNNLQTVLSLLSIQKRRVSGEEAILSIEQIQNRINSISLIHEKMYSQDNLEKLNLDKYCNELINTIKASYSVSDNFETELECNVEEMNFEIAVSAGIILNELLTNTLKHANGPSEGLVSKITVNTERDFLKIDYSDNGENKSEQLTEGMGSSLIRSFTGTKGSFTYQLRKNGFVANVTIPLKKE